MEMPLSRRHPMSLATQTGLVVLEHLHQSATNLEKEYMKSWLPSLNKRSANIEENVSLENVNPSEVVLKFKGQLGASIVTRNKNSRISAEAAKKSTRRKSGPNGNPNGVLSAEYIRYRKCLYLETIREWREQLCACLSPPVIDELMALVTRLFKHSKDKSETGVLTLQAVLMSSYTSTFMSATKTFYHNFKLLHEDTIIENRIGPTILRSSLSEGHRLTQLSMEWVCTDSILAVVGKVVTNLKYLNISYSLVTDRGLLNLCGVQLDSEAGGRPRLQRACKRQAGTKPGVVRNLSPRWTKIPNRGALSLTHLEARNLNNLTWHLDTVFLYTDYHSVPHDAGFVAVLTYLRQLKIFKTEVGGRAVMAYVRNRIARKKLKTDPLALEVLSESHPTPAMLTCLSHLCPHLRELRCDWYRFHTPYNTSREEWVPSLKKLNNFSSLFTSDIDYRTSNLSETLSVIGHRLTHLHLQELWSFKYSLMKRIKHCCPNLEKLSLLMTCKTVAGAISNITVEKDVDLALETSSREKRDVRLTNLRELNLVGPLGCDYVRYVIAGCDSLKSLTLGIEWPDPVFCNVIPGSQKDLLGWDYLQEVRSLNSLARLEEIHFFAQYSRGRFKLNKDFALFVISEFRNLKHLGSFHFWNMTSLDKRQIFSLVQQSNRDITFDEDYSEEPEIAGCLSNFRQHLKQNYSTRACSWLPMRITRHHSFLDEVAEIFAGPAVIWDVHSDDEEEDGNDNDVLDNLSDEDDFDDDSSDDDVDFLNDEIPIDFDPPCVIQ